MKIIFYILFLIRRGEVMTQEQKDNIKGFKKEGRKGILKGIGYSALALTHVIVPVICLTGTIWATVHFGNEKTKNEENINKIVYQVKESDDFKSDKEYDKQLIEQRLSDGSTTNGEYYIDTQYLDSIEYVENYMKNKDEKTYKEYSKQCEEKVSNRKKHEASLLFGGFLTLASGLGTFIAEEVVNTNIKDRVYDAHYEFKYAKRCFKNAKEEKTKE